MDKVSNRDVAVYALDLLGGWQERVHTEDVALKCYELAPSKFSWVKHPQYPDLSTARYALEAAAKPASGALVKGESERTGKKRVGGWMLTADGLRWVRANRARIEKSLREHIPSRNRRPAERKLSELIRSTAFQKFVEHGDQAEISHAEFAESLVCTVNTGRVVLNDRLEQLYSVAEELGIAEVRDFVDFSRRRFASVLQEKGEA